MVDTLSFISGSDKRRRKRKFLKLIIVFGASGIVVIGIIWLVIKSPIFEIKNENIEAGQGISRERVIDLIKGKLLAKSFLGRVVGSESLLSWPTGIFKEDLIPSFSDVLSLEISKSYRDQSVLIKAFARQPIGVWCFKLDSPTRCFWFDNTGVMFGRAPSTSGNLIKVLFDYSQKGKGVGDKILPDRLVDNMTSIFQTIYSSGLSTGEIILQDIESEEAEVEVVSGPKIYFSLRYPADGYSETIDFFRSKPEFRNLDYLDFRVENRVYYK